MTRLRFLLTGILASLAACLPWRKKSMVLGYTQVTYSLMVKHEGGKRIWQWRTPDGQEMSPVFDDLGDAMKFGGIQYLSVRIPPGNTWVEILPA